MIYDLCNKHSLFYNSRYPTVVTFYFVLLVRIRTRATKDVFFMAVCINFIMKFTTVAEIVCNTTYLLYFNRNILVYPVCIMYPISS